jgi:hypothetical protein
LWLGSSGKPTSRKGTPKNVDWVRHRQTRSHDRARPCVGTLTLPAARQTMLDYPNERRTYLRGNSTKL